MKTGHIRDLAPTRSQADDCATMLGLLPRSLWAAGTLCAIHPISVGYSSCGRRRSKGACPRHTLYAVSATHLRGAAGTDSEAVLRYAPGAAVVEEEDALAVVCSP